ncbi:hypothetical protein OH491_27745 (plasmid) [Termitidicoccus mucosus]|uniref:hypothetical protein n=1 Tax=Termitidicoccus mucosus TaxID=1184151 RepID=UPI0031844486
MGSYGLNINVDPDVTGTALLRFNGGTLRELIDALLETNDLFWTRKRNMFYVKRTQVEFYYIEYPGEPHHQLPDRDQPQPEHAVGRLHELRQ